MKKVITYGTYDMLHFGHIRLLQRAKALGDYLIVGVTADDYDKSRGKINVKQTLMERIEEVKATGLADQIIVEEYEGQKIDDIRRYDVDIFTVGSDWQGKFDYLNEFCKVVYLPRTEGVSSSQIRTGLSQVRIGLAGNKALIKKYYQECRYVNGAEICCVYAENPELREWFQKKGIRTAENYEELLDEVDAVYIATHPSRHKDHILQAIQKGKHILCETPVALTGEDCKMLYQQAKKKGIVLFDAIKTAYATAYNRLLLLLKSGKIGEVLSVDATCTSLQEKKEQKNVSGAERWNSISAWGPAGMLPVFQILGTEYKSAVITSKIQDEAHQFDAFTKIDFTYPHAVASVKVGKGIKSEGELIVSGTEGYIYVPAPWWKTDYFEIRYENQNENQRYFYQLEGEGIRYEIAAFLRSIEKKTDQSCVPQNISAAIAEIMEQYQQGNIVRI